METLFNMNIQYLSSATEISMKLSSSLIVTKFRSRRKCLRIRQTPICMIHRIRCQSVASTQQTQDLQYTKVTVDACQVSYYYAIC